jgi:glucose-1-phosphate adenylyltransferase
MGILNLCENENDIRSLTTNRSIASIPIGSRYRVIDFMLSNMVNSGIINVGIFSQSNSRSLVDHIGTGKPWDLNRKIDGIFLFNHGLDALVNYDSKLLKNNMEYIYKSRSENVILSSSYMICNLDLTAIVEEHEASGCDITVVYKKINEANTDFLNCFTLQVDENNRVTGVGKNIGFISSANICMELFLMKKEILIDLIYKNVQTSNKGNLYNVIFDSVGDLSLNAYEFKGYVACTNSIHSYYKANMDMLDISVSTELFRSKRPVFTKIKDEPPTLYVKGCQVYNSLIADGCIIEGTVRNSLVSRYVDISKDAVLDNCIILQNCKIKSGTTLSNVIVDKNAEIDENTELKGTARFPLVIEKRSFLSDFSGYRR